MREKITRILTIVLFTAVGIIAFQSGLFLYTFQPRLRALMGQYYEEEEKARLRTRVSESSNPSSAKNESDPIQKKLSAVQGEIQRMITLQRVAVITFGVSVAAYLVLIYFIVLRRPRAGNDIDISRFG